MADSAQALARLQSRAGALKGVINMGVPPELDQILACEALIQEVAEERTSLARRMASITPADGLKERKLAKDFARLSPTVIDVLAKANQACFEARMSLEQLHDEADEEDTAATVPPPSSLQQQQQQQQVQLALLDEQHEDQAKLLKSIELKAHSVRALHEDVASMISTQGDDVRRVAQQSGLARDDVVHGLGELAELKKREAGKHTMRGLTTSAVIGGSVGLIGGPIGVAIGVTAGAFVGSLLGSAVTSISRRNIDREVRAFKEKFKLSETADGYLACLAVAYENESWSFAERAWRSSSTSSTSGGDDGFYLHRPKWTADELSSRAIDAHDEPSPMNPHAPPNPPVIHTAAPKANKTRDAQEDDDDLEEEVLPPGKWAWASQSMWTPDIGDEDADTGGWRYAYNFQEGAVWTAQPTRTSLVRRRCWIRTQVLVPQRQVEEEEEEIRRRVAPAAAPSSSLLSSAITHMERGLDVSQATLSEVRFQGRQLDESARDTAMAEDASLFASRVSRAVTLSGVIRNTLSARPDTAYHQTSDVHVPSRRYHPTTAPPPPASSTSTSSVDHLQRLCEDQLHVSGRLHHEVTQQNDQLDSLLDASQRATQRVARAAKDMI